MRHDNLDPIPGHMLVHGLFWWRSDVGVTVGGGSGVDVQTIADQGSAGLDGIGEGGGLGGTPIVQDNTTAGFNEIKFAPSGAGWSRLRFTDASPFSGVTAAHIFASLELRNDPAASSGESGLWHFSPQDFGSLYVWHADSKIYDGFGGTTRYDMGDPTPALTSYRQIDVQNQSGASGFKWFIDGSQQGSSQTGDGSSWASSCWFGMSQNESVTNTLDGTFLDLFMYDHVLTGADLTAARAYVTARFDGSWTAAGGDG